MNGRGPYLSADERADFERGSLILVIYASPDAFFNPDLRDRGLSLLNGEELARHRRFVFDHSKNEFLLGRVMLRSVLANLLNTPPKEIEFDFGHEGKPGLAGSKSGMLHFNLSHTRGLVACAVSARHPVGIDVEVVDPERSTHGIAGRYFSSKEIEYLEGFTGADYTREFFRIWTLKEAYLKARGFGLTRPLKDFYIMPGEGREQIGIGFNESMKDDPEAWQFIQAELVSGKAMGLAIQRGRPPDCTIQTIIFAAG